MPKRSNPFQRLIYTIQHSVTADAVVTESKMLPNIRTGSPVEVDIVIEAETGTIPMIIGIECTATGRPATVEWVREMSGKHQDLPTDKLVLVSQSGFSSEAEEIAQAHNVEVITLREAEAFDWSQMVNQLTNNPNLRIAKFQIRNMSWGIKFDQAEKERFAARDDLAFSEGSEIYDSDGKLLGTIQQLWNSMLREKSIVERVMRRWIKEQKENFKLTWSAKEGTQIADAAGEHYRIRAIILDGYCEVESTPVSLAPATYGKTQVAYGKVPDIFSGSTGEVTVLFTEQEGEEAKGWLGFSSASGFGQQIFPANRPSTFYDSS